ncbi:sensor histidine kinase [Streptomyces lavendofoliae]|uniref:Histidine kinase n=1 Tax=Streptomyces lavendofoliae TaxID=67314 RepID=A0A918HX83_9ACTN|nr:GAF domain-containing protein [Streptomyces lavendofoliae]GGU40601.1 histidine kinase [Streptomyces lavendofoliae]
MTRGGLPALLEAVLDVGTDLAPHRTLQRLVEHAAGLTDARIGVLGVVDPGLGRPDGPHGTPDPDPGPGTDSAPAPDPGAPDPGAPGTCPYTGLYTVGMTEEDRRRVGRLPEGDDPGGRSFLGVPISVGAEVFGHLYLTGKRGGPFTDEDLAVLRVLAAQAGIAIGNARLYETARQRERWIEGAAAVTTALLTGEPAADALVTVAERARLLAGAAAGVVLQPTTGGGMEIVAASTPHDPDDLVGTAIAPGSPVLEQLLGGQPVFVEDSATDPRMTTPVRTRFGPSMMLPLRSGGKLIGTLALPRRRGGRPYTPVERQLASAFASQAALALVLADARRDRERLAVYQDRDRIARDLHDLVVQRLFATEMMLESTRRRAGDAPAAGLLDRAVDELDSTIQEVRTAIFALRQPPAEAPRSFRGRVLRETDGAAALLGLRPSVRFTGPVDALVTGPVADRLLAALRGALAGAHRHEGVTAVGVEVDAAHELPDGRPGVRLTVTDDGTGDDGTRGTTSTWSSPR